MKLDLERLRADTPGCAGRIHFNNAGAGLLAGPVVETMNDYVGLEAELGGNEADWETGTTLQVSGRAHVVWDEKETQARPGAERLVDVAIESVHRHEQAMAARWRLVDRSPLNPPLQTA